ncbi:TPA: hypothetical protein N0F65_010807 [Lagenidium giganteum]|uniref:Integrase catalytic domain-containing protein n=1 Tax=Lagenidium giganteum TaxID=4803 RepID=A0AAV2YHC6_9STRA|nr:TPA: hypothetical protein N0F65_010807 [Lagenidium giganteum]
MDAIGPMETTSKGGAKYALVVGDGLHTQVEEAKFMEFKEFMETQTGRKLRCIRTDNGSEFVNLKFRQYCAERGIQDKTSVPYSPQHHG